MAADIPPVLLHIEDGIADIRFNRPARLNAIDLPTALLFREKVLEAIAHPDVRVIVLGGEGRSFVAGGDLGYFHAAGVRAPEAAHVLIEPMHDAIARLAGARQPVLASLQGAVAGAGMSLALMADLAVAAEDCVFNLAYVKVGNSPDCSATWSLPRLVGLKKAFEIALLADNLAATEALRLGLVNRVVPVERLQAETRQLAHRLAASAPLAVASIKRQLRASLQRSLQEQLDDEAASFSNNAASADFREALDAFFARRDPVFTGR